MCRNNEGGSQSEEEVYILCFSVEKVENMHFLLPNTHLHVKMSI